MNNIYTGIELGSDSIKIVVSEKVNNKFHVLASVSENSMGVSRGFISNTKLCVDSCKRALKKIDEMLGIKITHAVLCIPGDNCKMDIVLGSVDVVDPLEITGEDIVNVLNDALKGQSQDNYEIVTSIPINFKVDDRDKIVDPKGMQGNTLETKVIITKVPKESLYRLLEVLKLSGVEVVDICFKSTGDYFTIKNKKYDSQVGAIINIGKECTNVSVFNKGIQIKNSIIPVGSINVDNDISYIYHTDFDTSRKIKEEFCVAMSSYADSNEELDVTLDDGTQKNLNQYDVSNVVEARVSEILKLAKNEIKNLTNREISYIIVTGGLSEIAGFQYLVDELLGRESRVCNITNIGVRHNKYSSVLGIIKYFDDKLCLRGRKYNMFDEDEIRGLIFSGEKTINNDNIIGKVFGHFFDN